MKELRTIAEVLERLSHNQDALRASVEEPRDELMNAHCHRICPIPHAMARTLICTGLVCWCSGKIKQERLS